MIAAASSARSFAVDTCCGAGKPVAVAKRVFFMPSRAASLFMRSTNASSDPAIVSASAIAASLPDCTIIPCSNSSTLTAFFGSMNMREPSARHALADTVTICEGASCLVLEGTKDQVRGHQLGQRRGFARLVGVLRDQRLAAEDVDQQIGLGGDRRRRHGRRSTTRSAAAGRRRSRQRQLAER